MSSESPDCPAPKDFVVEGVLFLAQGYMCQEQEVPHDA